MGVILSISAYFYTEMKPSEVIKAALASGELAPSDVHGDPMPPTPPTAAEEAQDAGSDSDQDSDYGDDSAAGDAAELAKAAQPQCEEEEEVRLCYAMPMIYYYCLCNDMCL